jgi:hypothetical protein
MLQSLPTPSGFLRRFLSKNIPSCLSFRPSSVLRQQLHSSTMRLLSRLEADRKSGAIWYVLFRQSPYMTSEGVSLGNSPNRGG